MDEVFGVEGVYVNNIIQHDDIQNFFLDSVYEPDREYKYIDDVER